MTENGQEHWYSPRQRSYGNDDDNNNGPMCDDEDNGSSSSPLHLLFEDGLPKDFQTNSMVQAAIHIDDSDSEEQVSEETSDSPSSTKCCGAPRSSSMASYSSSIMETDQRSSIPPSVAHIDRNRDQSIELPPAPFSNSVCSTSSAIVDDVNLPRQHSIECDGNHSSKRSYEAGHLDPVGGIKNQELGGRRNRRTRSHSYDGAMGSDHTWSASGGKSDLSSPFAPNSHHSRKWKHRSGGPASRRNRNIRNDESRPYAQNSRTKRKRSQRSERDVDRELSLYMHMWKL